MNAIDYSVIWIWGISSFIRKQIFIIEFIISLNKGFKSIWTSVEVLCYVEIIGSEMSFAKAFFDERTYNHFHNILKLFDALPNSPFATSETMRDYYL